ncbi:MAG: hypothetical protein MUF85_02350, partial [Patescibacteria group bacterium]|nr:hypothetical protein [Patescibacteria group bacterium]
HPWRPRNFIFENKFSREAFLATRHRRVSPQPYDHNHTYKQACKSVATPPRLGPSADGSRPPVLRTATGSSH